MHEQEFTTDNENQSSRVQNAARIQIRLAPADMLRAQRDQIMSKWVKRTNKEVSHAPNLDTLALVNDLPKLVDCISRALASSSTVDVAEECKEIAYQHGSGRARLSEYDPDELVQEYCLLCEVLLDELDAEVGLTLHDFKIVYKVIGKALKDAMVAYSEIQTNFRERFIATLAHDLRNPLGVARTAAELIGLECDNPKEVSFLADRLKTNLGRADDLMQSLLDVAYTHSGYELNYKMEQIDVSRLICETVQSMTLTHGSRFFVTGDSLTGYWNKSAMRRSIENLLTNALKYGDPDKQITVDFKKVDDKVQIRVHNEGRPIPAADQQKIFQPFRREKTVLTAKPGWGLGLCFVQTATEAHGGRVRVKSAENYGTDFILELPQDARKVDQRLQH